MQRAQLIPLGAGVIAALLHLSVTLGSSGAFMFAYFAQAPIVATGLALGFMPAAVAAAIAAVLVALGSPGVGALSLFVLTSALPVLLIVYFAIQNRVRDGEGEDGSVEWYPVGRLLGWLTALALIAFVAAYLLFSGAENGVSGISGSRGGVMASDDCRKRRDGAEIPDRGRQEFAPDAGLQRNRRADLACNRGRHRRLNDVFRRKFGVFRAQCNVDRDDTFFLYRARSSA